MMELEPLPSGLKVLKTRKSTEPLWNFGVRARGASRGRIGLPGSGERI